MRLHTLILFDFRVHFNATLMSAHQRPSDWSIDYGYKITDKNQKPYPYRVIDAGVYYSLFVILKASTNDIDHLCGGSAQGYKIGFHPPNDIPDMKKDFFDLSPKQAVFYSIEPRYVKAADNIRKFSPQTRRCYFNGERRLRFYQQYTRNNCFMECEWKFCIC